MRDEIYKKPDPAEITGIIEPSPSMDEERWGALTKAANDAFARREFSDACQIYRSALGIAEDLLERAERNNGPMHAPALLVVTHHNIAEVLLAEGRGAMAIEHHRAAFERLLKVVAAKSAPDALRQSCASHLQPALIALATLLQTSGAPAHVIARDIRRARCVVTGAIARA